MYFVIAVPPLSAVCIYSTTVDNKYQNIQTSFNSFATSQTRQMKTDFCTLISASDLIESIF